MWRTRGWIVGPYYEQQRVPASCRPAYLQILIIISLAETYLSKICFKTLNDGRISRGAGRFDSTARLNTVSDAGALVLTFERPGSVWRRPGGGTIRIGVLHYGTYQSLRQRTRALAPRTTLEACSMIHIANLGLILGCLSCRVETVTDVGASSSRRPTDLRPSFLFRYLLSLHRPTMI